ncbi:hypothetical protein T439DRAFT_380627 [Meredithblackwellia eburnea MCA 4105]
MEADAPRTEPQTGKAKTSKATGSRLGRTRAACQACRVNKQKCDAPAQIPCRRCVLYHLKCSFDNTPDAQPSPTRSTSPQQTTTPRTVPAVAVVPAKKRQPVAPTIINSSPSHDSDVTVALKDIKAHLRRIEASLESDRKGKGRPFSAASEQQPSPSSIGAGDIDDLDDDSIVMGHKPSLANPMDLVSDSVSRIIENGASSPAWPSPAAPASEGAPPNVDAILLGVVSLEECRQAFHFFHERMQPWSSILGDPQDRDPLNVYTRSPFLFHVILLISIYFDNNFRNGRYTKLTLIVNELFSQQILCPDSRDINTDLICALNLLLLYKPVQEEVFRARGITNPARAEHASKINVMSSKFLHSLISDVSRACGLPSAPARFFSTTSAKSTASEQERRKALADLRLWYWLCMSDVHGSLQSGRPTAIDPTNALRTTRSFASLRHLPTDIRSAAMVDLYAILRSLPSISGDQGTARMLLKKINSELSAWDKHWIPLLIEAQQNGDPLAWTTFKLLRHFCCMTANSTVFYRWLEWRKQHAREGEVVRPAISSEDWGNLDLAIRAAEETLFALSAESAPEGFFMKEVCDWPPPIVTGYRGPLSVNNRVVTQYQGGMDTVSCVMVSFPLLLLVRLASAGLLSCELECKRSEYESGSPLDIAQPLTQGRKLPRLIELGAAFLHQVAPGPHHPANKQSLLMTLILQAGLKPDTPSGPVPPSPVPAAPVPSPASLQTWFWDTPISAPASTSTSNSNSVASPGKMNDAPSTPSNKVSDDISTLLYNIDPGMFPTYQADYFTPTAPFGGIGEATIDWDALEASWAPHA